MAITVGGTAITFPDATTQTTAASASIPGIGGQVFTSGGTFTIPTGVTLLKVTVVGGGGGSAYTSGCSWIAGGSGGTSSVSSGTQTISTISASGGSGGSSNGQAATTGGIGSGADINMRGSGASVSADVQGFGTIFGNKGGQYQQSLYGAGGYLGSSAGSAIKYLTGLTPGNTLSVTVGNGGSSGTWTGGTGIVVFEW